MDKSIIIKSNKHGLSLFIDEKLDFEEVCEKLRNKLRETRKFFGNASMALTIEGKVLSGREINNLLDIIDEESDLEILAVIDNQEVNDTIYTSALNELMQKLDDNACEIYPLTVCEDSCLEFKSSVIILGDVPESSEIHSNGSIFILGCSYGKLYAGELGNINSCVYAGDLQSDIISIADISYKKPKINEKKGIFNRRKNKTAVNNSALLRVADDKIVSTIIKADIEEQ
ncbi:MAG: septum site-determining protein MinC [Clostridiales bacterium]|nr:septum site-determining protein MinC [Clostridiales bacterium]